jgi:hypothetical protein
VACPAAEPAPARRLALGASTAPQDGWPANPSGRLTGTALAPLGGSLSWHDRTPPGFVAMPSAVRMHTSDAVVSDPPLELRRPAEPGCRVAVSS